MARALIGITSEMAAARWGDWVREAVLSPQSYSRAVERAGAVPVLIPPIPPGGIPRLIERLDGVLFTGGSDVDPALYGAVRHERTDEPDAGRDRFELALARAVVDARLPFLALCRGLHVVNVARGGTLVQYLPDTVGHDRHAPDRARLGFHDVRIDPASTLGGLLGDKALVPVAPSGRGPARRWLCGRRVGRRSGRGGSRVPGSPVRHRRAMASRGER